MRGCRELWAEVLLDAFAQAGPLLACRGRRDCEVRDQLSSSGRHTADNRETLRRAHGSGSGRVRRALV